MNSLQTKHVTIYGILGLLFVTQVVPSSGMSLASNAASTTSQRLHRSRSMDEFYPDKVIHMFRYDVRGELGDCWKALSDGNAAAMEGENHRAYELYKKAICGTGNSEYTRIFTDYVNISIEAYCTCKNLTPLTTNQFGAREIQRFAGLHRFDDIGFVLVSMADAESNLINAEALRKEALFWLRLDEDNPDVPNEIARLQGSLSKGRE